MDSRELPLRSPGSGRPYRIAELQHVLRIGRWSRLRLIVDLQEIDVSHQELRTQRVTGVGNDQHVPVGQVRSADCQLREPRACGEFCRRGGADTIANRAAWPVERK